MARRPFTPDGAGTDPPLLRVALLRLGAAEHHFVFVAHHLIFDLRSADLLVRELTTLYDAAVAGRAVRLPTLDRDAADLAHAERRARQEGRFDAALDAWRRALADPPRVDLPTDRERPREPAHRAWSHSFTLSAERAAALERIGRERGATLFMTLLAAFHATLARWSGESRFLVACPVTGRGAAARDLLGFFAYPLLIVHEWPGEAAATSFETVLASARAAALDAYGRQDVPFARVIEATRGARLVPRLLFGLVDEVVARPETVELQTIELEKGATDFDLAVTLRRARGGDGSLRGRLEAPRALFDAATLELLVDTFLEVLETVAEAPRTLLGELPATALAAHGERLRRLREPWTLAVSATFTADPLSDPLKLWMDELGRPARIVLAPYHQMLQDLLSPSSDLGRNRFGANLLLVRLEDLWRFAAEGETGAPLARAEAWIGEFVDALGSAVERSMQDKAGDGARRGLHWLVALCPPSPGARREHPGLDALEDALAEAVAALPGVDLLRADVLGGPEPPGQIHDPHADELGHIPYTPLYFAALATAFARRLHAANRPPVKILAVDADETLWRGVVGEDGPLGVVVDGPRRAFQQRLLTQREAGRLLAICSKNVEADVREVLASHPDMVLRPEHISAWAVSWRPKSSGLAEIAQTLDLGLDSIVFLDDNPLEIAEVEANAPEVTAIALPADPEQDAAPGTNTLARFLDHLWVLDIDRTTDEDRRRAAWYAEETARAARRRAAPSLADFLAALELEVRIDPAVADDAPRLAQLTERTNQFHCAKRARGETEILGGELAAHAVRVRDRFGDYGLVGALLSRPHGDALRAETFLLSCRALGRGVEHRMLAALGEFAVERGLAAVEIPFERAPRNRPALDFLRAVVGDGEIPGAAGGALFRIAADDAARVVFAPAEEVVASPSAPAERQTDERRTDTAEAPPELLRRGGAVLRRAALELAGAERVLDAARARRAASRRPTGEAVLAPSTPTEKELAALWSDLLGVGEVGANADFFDLGGDSLLGVQLISRVRERFGVEIPLRDLLSDTFTVAKMAEVVEEHQIRDADDEDLDDILAELDGLSDEEIRALLESEETSEV